MIDQHKVLLFKELLQQAESVLVIYAPDALRDHLFAATALYKALQQLGTKDVALLSSENLSEVESDIAYLEDTKTEIGRKNLCITLDYTSDTVEKITSAIDEAIQKLHITIKPKKGNAPISKENVTFSYTGAEADMVILVGVDDLESLDQLYIGYENLYQSSALVSINSYETAFGNLKLDILGSSCVSEYITDLLRSLEFQIDNESATNLLAGIDEETENLESYLATADTFEIVSFLLRAGARRFAREKKEDTPEGSEVEIYDADDEVVVTNAVDHSGNDSENESDIEQQPVQLNLQPGKQTSSFAAHLAAKHQSKINTQKKLSPFEKILQRPPKKGRGRPKGSLNKPKPGDLGFTPSGFGPSSV